MKKWLVVAVVITAVFNINAEAGGIKDLLKKEFDKKHNKNKKEAKNPSPPSSTNPPKNNSTGAIIGPALNKNTKFQPWPKSDAWKLCADQCI